MGIFGGSTLLLVGYIYWATIGYVQQLADTNLQTEIADLAERFRIEGVTGLAGAVHRRSQAGGSPPTFYVIVTPAFEPIAGNLTTWPEGHFDPAGWFVFTVSGDGESLPAKGRIFQLQGGQKLLIARQQAELQAAQGRLDAAYRWSMVVAVGLAALGGILMSLSVTRRIDDINRTSREILAGGGQRRMPVRGVHDEFDQLAENLNVMLDRIDLLIDGVKAVADNIAHDLRTPLARLRGRIEAVSRRPEVSDEARAELAAAISDADHLLATFRALLRIARIESGSHDREWEELDLEPLVHDAWEMYHVVGEDQEIDVGRDLEPARIRGDRDLIFQAVSNLLDNAIKYSPPGSPVHVALREQDGEAIIAVSDRGPGIPAAEREKVIDRFYRSASVAGIPGSGLGLSLVNAIARHHRGRLVLADNGPGLVATLHLPALDSTGSAGHSATQAPA